MNATEEAISLMRGVLENVRPPLPIPVTTADGTSSLQPEPIKNLASLIKAQQAFHAAAAESLAAVQAEFDEASVQADAEYRKSRAQ